MKWIISHYRQLSILLLLTINSFCSKAQLAPVGTTWTCLFSNSGGGPSPTYYKTVHSITGDSIIDSNVYSVVGNPNFEYLLAEDSGSIYYFDNGKRRLFFNFMVKALDTVYVDFKFLFKDSIIEAFPIQIDSSYFILTPQGDSLKQVDFHLLMDPQEPIAWDLSITEKLLHGQRSPIFGPYLYKPVSDFMEEFMCYNEPNGFAVQYVPDCDRVGILEINNDPQLKLFPNPVNHLLSLRTNLQLKGHWSYSLYNSIGILVLRGNFSGSDMQIDVSNLIDDFYFCVIENENEENKQVVKVFVSHKD